MRILVAGGVFRLSLEELAARQPAPEIVLANGLRAAGVEVITVPLEARDRLARSRDVDIVHVHHLSRGAVAAALSPLAAPLVFTAHSIREPATILERAGHASVMRRMAAGVCLSDSEARMRARLDPSIRHKLHVVPNGLNLPTNAHRRAVTGRVRALFVGQLIPVKQIERALHSVAAMPSLELRLVFHNDQLLPDLRRLAADLQISERVKFVGQRSGEALFDEYRRADFLVLPSLLEALPSVVIEALSTGLPVVASAVGGIPDQVGGAGVVVPNTGDQAFVAGVRKLLTDFDNYAGRAADHAAHVQARFSVHRMVQGHLNIYRSLAAGGT